MAVARSYLFATISRCFPLAAACASSQDARRCKSPALAMRRCHPLHGGRLPRSRRARIHRVLTRRHRSRHRQRALHGGNCPLRSATPPTQAQAQHQQNVPSKQISGDLARQSTPGNDRLLIALALNTRPNVIAGFVGVKPNPSGVGGAGGKCINTTALSRASQKGTGSVATFTVARRKWVGATVPVPLVVRSAP
jgi:hypothetical protein